MSNIGSYNTRKFSENQKFLVLDPSTGTTSLVLGSDLVNYITPNLGYVYSETTRLAAENTDYKVGSIIQTAGSESIGDNFAATYIVVEGGTGDFPMLNGNDLLTIKGDEFLREQLISEAVGQGASLVSMEGGPTVEQAVNERVIRVSSRAEMKAYDVPAGTQFSLEEGGRSGLFVRRAGTPPVSDPQEGIYVIADAGGYDERIVTEGTAYAGWFGISADGSDETSKWSDAITVMAAKNLALGEFVGETLITSQLVLPSGFGGIYGNNQLQMSFKKGFNGELFSLNSQGMTLEGFWIKGDGANFTGGGVYGVSDNISINHVRIDDTEDSPIICKSNDFTFASVDDCFLQATDSASVASIRSDGNDLSTTPTTRFFSKISGSLKIADVSGMNYAVISDSLFTDIDYSATSSKIILSNVRITAASNDIEVLGNDHVIEGSIISMGASNDLILSGDNITFDSSNAYSKGTNTKASPIISSPLGGGLTGNIHTNLVTYTSSLEWRGTTSDGSFGNSTYSAYYKLSGRKCYVTVYFIRGSTATMPVGDISFNLPFEALVTSNCPVFLKSSSGTFYSAVGQVFGGSDNMLFYLNQGTGPVNDGTVAFGAGGILSFTMEYLVAP